MKKYWLTVLVLVTVVIVGFVAVANLIGPIEVPVLDDGSTYTCSDGTLIDPEVGKSWCRYPDDPFNTGETREIVAVRKGYVQYKSSYMFSFMYWFAPYHTAKVSSFCGEGRVYDEGCFAIPLPPKVTIDPPSEKDVETPDEDSLLSGKTPAEIGAKLDHDCVGKDVDVRVGDVYEFQKPENPFTKNRDASFRITAVEGKHYLAVLSPSGKKITDDAYWLCVSEFYGRIKLKTRGGTQ